jgi:hypothetical protein
MSELFTFHSPLPIADVRSSINKRCMNAHFGAVLAILGAVTPPPSVSGNEGMVAQPRRTTGVALFGKVRDRRVRLQAPHAFNNSEPRLVGTLEEASDGGTLLRAHYEFSAGTWSRSESYNTDQMRHIVETLASTASLVPVSNETT